MVLNYDAEMAISRGEINGPRHINAAPSTGDQFQVADMRLRAPAVDSASDALDGKK
jgi:hypothetical protein